MMGAQIASLSNKDEEYNHSLVSATKSKRDQTLHLETANDVAYSPTNSQEYHLRSLCVLYKVSVNCWFNLKSDELFCTYPKCFHHLLVNF